MNWPWQRTIYVVREETVMAEIDDLKAALAADDVKLDGIAKGVGQIATEVADLIAKLQNLPPSPGLADVLASATSLGSKMDTITQAIAAIPPEPA